ncbi:TonB-dependent receptor [Salinisphaera japonica]|uniref:Uncharacterized protein n=1 Tax=Salinisphaera japonica YTM-1 TaxID=1209778 RepID=A0A423Q301_9GAMM|nr:TonB-dependent receptor [Salinisphaera japonica]ROO32923.1 hypothetical protein SAJA_01065 [Salinisphaera japonica YTM-1]
MPDYTLFCVFGEVELTDNLTVFGSINNLFDTDWYASSYARLCVQPGTPRALTAGGRATF